MTLMAVNDCLWRGSRESIASAQQDQSSALLSLDSVGNTQ